MENRDWFEHWFDTKFYHLLYRHRNDQEAKDFLDRLLHQLKLRSGARIQDLACGAGRHSIYLNSLGYEVTGLDLSQNSIAEASRSGNADLHFRVHDMREVYKPDSFDAIFNLFTSFGYFQNQDDNQKVVESVYEGLKAGGTFVLDYLNAAKVVKELPSTENKTLEGYQFEIEKDLVDGRIQKEIRIQGEGRSMCYVESVFPFSEKDLKALLMQAGFRIESGFGDYELNPFNEETSDRLILVATKEEQ